MLEHYCEFFQLLWAAYNSLVSPLYEVFSSNSLDQRKCIFLVEYYSNSIWIQRALARWPYKCVQLNLVWYSLYLNHPANSFLKQLKERIACWHMKKEVDFWYRFHVACWNIRCPKDFLEDIPQIYPKVSLSAKQIWPSNSFMNS